MKDQIRKILGDFLYIKIAAVKTIFFPSKKHKELIRRKEEEIKNRKLLYRSFYENSNLLHNFRENTRNQESITIVKMMDGLGNQLFQYAIGTHHSIINNTVLKFDLQDYILYEPPRKFSLDVYRIKGSPATNEDIKKIITFKETLISSLYKLFNLQYKSKTKISEKIWFTFDETILKTGKNIYLTGHWQSYKYFEAIRSTLLKDLELISPPTNSDYPFLYDMKNKESVSIHIRRGDYLSNPKAAALFEVCSPSYYYQAIEYICNRISNPVFYIFSDDWDWVENNFKINQEHIYVRGTPKEKDYFELYLMSICKHNIIANSSFSWWGAWLNKNADKIVIAPKQWTRFQENTADLSPENWVRLQ